MRHIDSQRSLLPVTYGLGASLFIGLGWLIKYFPDWFWFTVTGIGLLTWKVWKWLKG